MCTQYLGMLALHEKQGITHLCNLKEWNPNGRTVDCKKAFFWDDIGFFDREVETKGQSGPVTPLCTLRTKPCPLAQHCVSWGKEGLF